MPGVEDVIARGLAAPEREKEYERDRKPFGRMRSAECGVRN